MPMMRMKRAFLSLFWAVLVLTSVPASAGECTVNVGYRATHINGRIVAIWYPTDTAPKDYAYGPNFSSVLAHDAPPSPACGGAMPLVVFSHGDLGCGLQSVTFTEEL